MLPTTDMYVVLITVSLIEINDAASVTSFDNLVKI